MASFPAPQNAAGAPGCGGGAPAVIVASRDVTGDRLLQRWFISPSTQKLQPTKPQPLQTNASEKIIQPGDPFSMRNPQKMKKRPLPE